MYEDPTLIPAKGVKRVHIINANVTTSGTRIGGHDIAIYDLPKGVEVKLVDSGRTLEIRGKTRPEMRIGSVAGSTPKGMGVVYFSLHYPLPDVQIMGTN